MIGSLFEGLVDGIATALFPPAPERKWPVRIFWALLAVAVAAVIALLTRM